MSPWVTSLHLINLWSESGKSMKLITIIELKYKAYLCATVNLALEQNMATWMLLQRVIKVMSPKDQETLVNFFPGYFDSTCIYTTIQ